MLLFRQTCYRLLAGWLLTGVAMAADTTLITLVNGMTMTGTVTSIEQDGLGFQIGPYSRVYPWPTLAPGTRFRYDAQYRMNVAELLGNTGGVVRLNPPDPQYDPMNPDAIPLIADDVTEPLQAFSLNAFDPSGPFDPSAIRALRGLPATKTVFTGYQYGPATNHAAVFGFVGETPERLAAWNAANNRTASLQAGNDAFSGQTYAAAWGDATLQTTFVWSAVPTGRTLTASVTWSDNARKETFVLHGQPALRSAGAQPVQVRTLLDEPQMEWRLRQNEEARWHLSGRVRMGRLTWYPGPESELRGSVQIRAGNRTLATHDLAYASDTGVAHPLQLMLETGFKPGNYLIVTTLNLGSFLGTLKHEQPVTIRPPPGIPQQ